MRILLMAGILLQKTRLNVLLVNTLSILKSPTTDDISQMVYSKAKRLERGRVKPR
jgi:hypothetical protein